MKITKIIFPVPNDTLGNSTDSECNEFRNWFANELRAAYPGAAVTVTNKPGRISVDTDDDCDDAEIISTLREFGNSCWDYCPWDRLNTY